MKSMEYLYDGTELSGDAQLQADTTERSLAEIVSLDEVEKATFDELVEELAGQHEEAPEGISMRKYRMPVDFMTLHKG